VLVGRGMNATVQVRLGSSATRGKKGLRCWSRALCFAWLVGFIARRRTGRPINPKARGVPTNFRYTKGNCMGGISTAPLTSRSNQKRALILAKADNECRLSPTNSDLAATVAPQLASGELAEQLAQGGNFSEQGKRHSETTYLRGQAFQHRRSRKRLHMEAFELQRGDD